MFDATTGPGRSWIGITIPLPRPAATTGPPTRVKSRSEWQPSQAGNEVEQILAPFDPLRTHVHSNRGSGNSGGRPEIHIQKYSSGHGQKPPHGAPQNAAGSSFSRHPLNLVQCLSLPSLAGPSAKLTLMILGFHHVTALAGDAQRNLDFYTQFAGAPVGETHCEFRRSPLRIISIMEPVPERPEPLLTFSPWGFHRQPRRGAGQAVSIKLSVPPGVFAQQVNDPDGLDIRLVAGDSTPRLHSVTLCEKDLEATTALLTSLGFERASEEGNRAHFELPGGAARIDVLHEPNADHGNMGAGMIHHVALRVADEAGQLTWRDKLIAAGIRVSPVKDRLYFHSIYFRQPGGTLFEIATDGPGFLIDEPEDSLAPHCVCRRGWSRFETA